jgi:hypothetical protein
LYKEIERLKAMIISFESEVVETIKGYTCQLDTGLDLRDALYYICVSDLTTKALENGSWHKYFEDMRIIFKAFFCEHFTDYPTDSPLESRAITKQLFQNPYGGLLGKIIHAIGTPFVDGNGEIQREAVEELRETIHKIIDGEVLTTQAIEPFGIAHADLAEDGSYEEDFADEALPPPTLKA